MKRITDEQAKKIKTLAKYEIPQRVIADVVGVAPYTVSTLLSESPMRTVTLRSIGKDRRCKLTDEDIAEIKELYEKGWSQISIAKLFNVHQTTVTYYVNPARKEYANKRSAKYHCLYMTPEESARRALESYHRKRKILQEQGMLGEPRKKSPKLEQETIDQMCEYRKAGMSYEKIAELTGYSLMIVNRAVITAAPELRQRQRFTREQVEGMISDRKAGMSYKDLCEKYGCRVSTIAWHTLKSKDNKTASKERRKKNVD